MLNRAGFQIVMDGAEDNEITERPNTQLWGMVETEGEEYGAVLLGGG